MGNRSWKSNVGYENWLWKWKVGYESPGTKTKDFYSRKLVVLTLRKLAKNHVSMQTGYSNCEKVHTRFTRLLNSPWKLDFLSMKMALWRQFFVVGGRVLEYFERFERNWLWLNIFRSCEIFYIITTHGMDRRALERTWMPLKRRATTNLQLKPRILELESQVNQLGWQVYIFLCSCIFTTFP